MDHNLQNPSVKITVALPLKVKIHVELSSSSLDVLFFVDPQSTCHTLGFRNYIAFTQMMHTNIARGRVPFNASSHCSNMTMSHTHRQKLQHVNYQHVHISLPTNRNKINHSTNILAGEDREVKTMANRFRFLLEQRQSSLSKVEFHQIRSIYCSHMYFTKNNDLDKISV